MAINKTNPMRQTVLCLLIIAASAPLLARKPRGPRVTEYPNIITANAPVFLNMGEYPGVALGIGYERYLDKGYRYSVSFSPVNRYWGGTNSAGKLQPGEERANLQGIYCEPGFFYHPFESGYGADLSFGAVLPIGTMRRKNAAAYPIINPAYVPEQNSGLVALAGQVNASVHSGRGFVFGAMLSYGALLQAADVRGPFLQCGLRFGRCF